MFAITAPTCRRVHGLLALAACALLCGHPAALAQTPPNTTGATTLANPASQHCVDAGGKLSIEKNGSGGEFGVCTFGDNLQCEEWAMLRGDCREGGIKVTGYVTPAARYCAITGGNYKTMSNSNTTGEQGSCRFMSGKTCTAAAYFDGTCTRDASAHAAIKQIRANFACDESKSVAATFINGSNSSVKLSLSDGRKLSLPQAMSGSGARYANRDESIVFWNKGNTAFVEENGKMTYTGCTTRR